MKFRIAIATLMLGFAASVIPLAAHHSVTATFDTSKEVLIRGVVSKIEWTNPHARFWVDVRSDDGAVATWELELPPPNALMRQRNLSSDFIKISDQVTVVVWRAKDGSRLANVLDLSLPDGRILTFGRDTTNDWTMLPVSPRPPQPK
jgi:hypothetical protein